MRKRAELRLLTAGLALATAAACDRDREPVVSETPIDPPAATDIDTDTDRGARTPESDVKDADITAAVRRELLHDAAVDVSKLQIQTTNGIVELTGAVDNLLAKERATRHAEVVKGVRGVSNRLQIDAEKRADDAIVSDIETALLFDAAADAYELDVSSKDGVVTLDGTVQSWQEKKLAERTALGVRGVRDIKNEIDVEFKDERPDAEIARDIETRMRWDVLLDHGLVDVNVDDGKVKLSGFVGSSAEKSRAFFDAWVRGAKDVDASALDVKWWARNEELRKDKYVNKPNSEIENAVKDAMLYDPRVNSFDLSVDVNAGIATLRGNVDNAKAKAAAEQLAKNTVGVLSVSNLIRASGRELDDSEIARRVRSGLMISPITESYEIDTQAQDGKVVLKGTVDSFYEKAEAEDIASGVQGVTAVDNQIQVEQPTSYVLDAYVYPYDPYVTNWTYGDTIARKPDVEITEDIRDELFWSPFVDRGDITVTVVAGKATLTGTVDTWRERAAASENAFEGGAIAVDNDLRLD